jgi:hydroxyacylglutathione hydrolase
VVSKARGEAAAVDGPEAAPALDACRALGVRLTTILNTHTHPDHVGINHALGDLSSIRVVGPKRKAADVPGLDEPVDEGDALELFGVPVKVMLTEGHIDGHVSYALDGAVFCGDTLFAAGCGYLFDGPPVKMHDSLQRLSGLPDDTRVFCAHEYTQDNLRFAWSVEPDNEALRDRIRAAWAVRARGESTVPSTIGLEKATNPFLRPYSTTIRRTVAEAFPGRELATDADVFAATRALKDEKTYRERGDDVLPLG